MSSPDGDRASAPRNLIERAREQVAAKPWRDSLVAGTGGFIAILALASARAELSANLMIAPFGASCVLVFAIPQSPLARREMSSAAT
jgi:CBS-domain-containing membrane protein